MRRFGWSAVRSWLQRRPAAADWLEGAGMVWGTLPPRSNRAIYAQNDVVGLIVDMAMVGNDLRRGMREYDKIFPMHGDQNELSAKDKANRR